MLHLHLLKNILFIILQNIFKNVNLYNFHELLFAGSLQENVFLHDLHYAILKIIKDQFLLYN